MGMTLIGTDSAIISINIVDARVSTTIQHFGKELSPSQNHQLAGTMMSISRSVFPLSFLLSNLNLFFYVTAKKALEKYIINLFVLLILK